MPFKNGVLEASRRDFEGPRPPFSRSRRDLGEPQTYFWLLGVKACQSFANVKIKVRVELYMLICACTADLRASVTTSQVSLLEFANFRLWGARPKKAADQTAARGRPALRAGPTQQICLSLE